MVSLQRPTSTPEKPTTTPDSLTTGPNRPTTTPERGTITSESPLQATSIDSLDFDVLHTDGMIAMYSLQRNEVQLVLTEHVQPMGKYMI
jgi:hypothetical protein